MGLGVRKCCLSRCYRGPSERRGEVSLVQTRGQMVMSVPALFVLYGRYVRLYQPAPLCLIYNSIVCGKPGPVFTIQDTIKYF